MSTITYESTLTHQRIERKHTKASMASLLFRVWHLVNALAEDGLTDENEKKLAEIQTQIAWG